jgi:hypothetical protein
MMIDSLIINQQRSRLKAGTTNLIWYVVACMAGSYLLVVAVMEAISSSSSLTGNGNSYIMDQPFTPEVRITLRQHVKGE